MVSILERRGVTAVLSALLAAGTLTVPATAEAATPRAAGAAVADPAVLPMQGVVLGRNVTFGGGVPVGGWYSLSVFPSGTYSYSGHMHVSGAPSYTFAGVCVVRFTNGTAFVFQTSGRLHGTFESGSRDHNWSTSGSRQSIRDAWKNSGGGWNARCSNRVDIDLGALVNSTVQAVGYAARVIAIVA
ncbi:hypothetical protein OG739_29065 [Streptomyces longwoodensis]|uniref:hypothetical protein n=1 Tax=Streptomyces longwoodensis TaxID=68231 RepID=UPI00225B64A7|nr:hypothetical protein [Streptomyces longwoodensis]MCX4996754.1 hypothetical protein [Streptomyces longwoodensis]WRY91421.1 hypothetical protein OG481_24220 [Streptomyces longwoodensis]WTI44284.1 hypothetical protein OG547_07070 [Streptomyces longwoodensis]WUC70581.1 hypothetical protein OG416_07090 [Streptomyces longwoodensis]